MWIHPLYFKICIVIVLARYPIPRVESTFDNDECQSCLWKLILHQVTCLFRLVGSSHGAYRHISHFIQRLNVILALTDSSISIIQKFAKSFCTRIKFMLVVSQQVHCKLDLHTHWPVAFNEITVMLMTMTLD